MTGQTDLGPLIAQIHDLGTGCQQPAWARKRQLERMLEEAVRLERMIARLTQEGGRPQRLAEAKAELAQLLDDATRYKLPAQPRAGATREST